MSLLRKPNNTVRLKMLAQLTRMKIAVHFLFIDSDYVVLLETVEIARSRSFLRMLDQVFAHLETEGRFAQSGTKEATL